MKIFDPKRHLPLGWDWDNTWPRLVLGHCASARNYPRHGMPATFGELAEMWGDEDDPGEMDALAKRLLLFTPDSSYWHTIRLCWENAIHRTVAEATGLQDVTYQVMLDAIVNSVG